jgi:hypothetical protein
MSSVDIFYLVLVISAIAGFAISLGYFSEQDLKFRTARQRAADQASKHAVKQPKPKMAQVERTFEHA